MNSFLKKTSRFIVKSIGIILGLIFLLIVWMKASMISPSFVDQELHNMGLYDDFPDFPSYRIRGYRHSIRRSRYDYTLKLDCSISPTVIRKIDSLCKTYEGHLRWQHDEENGRYILFLWDIANDYSDFLIVTPEENKAKFVFHPFSRIPTKENDDLFWGPIYGEECFYERQKEQNEKE